MSKILGIIFILLILKQNIFAKKVLIIEYSNVNNYQIKRLYKQATIINSPFFLKNLKCEKVQVPLKYSIFDIINYLENSRVNIKNISTLKNQEISDEIFVKKIVIIDLKYKILEKNHKRYYIFNVCYPEKRKRFSFLKKILEFFNGY